MSHAPQRRGHALAQAGELGLELGGAGQAGADVGRLRRARGQLPLGSAQRAVALDRRAEGRQAQLGHRAVAREQAVELARAPLRRGR